MRLALVLLAGAVAPAAISVSPAAPRPVSQVRAPVQVQVDARCTGAEVTFTLSPWTARLAQGDSIEWRLHPDAHTTEIRIEPKQGRWPFAAATPSRGTKAAPARATGMRPNQGGGQRFSYAVHLVCESPTSGPHTVVVDPEIIVD